MLPHNCVLELFGFRKLSVSAGGARDGFRPVVGLRRKVKLRSHRRAANLPELDLDSEEADLLFGDANEPVKRSAVRIADLPGNLDDRRNPDDRHGVQAHGVRWELAQVAMVCQVELIFDQHHLVVDRVPT